MFLKKHSTMQDKIYCLAASVLDDGERRGISLESFEILVSCLDIHDKKNYDLIQAVKCQDGRFYLPVCWNES